ncbi:hypothetical protein SEA_THUNDERCLAP_7 [Arthrobacter phage Thunderclap]|uniref:Uncharacterized protein n=5 Tax=Amigovirus amigo TaxID=1982100 RepID=A0A5J6TF67_9CAUD|nr:hypothetical protein SEA_YEEZUS_7 [Arthrobacter phage Yeezus]QFG13434.1 hypothetical protein SEA_ICHOR_7 [Arthrobacter phage Ichor]QFG13952.1 hypothetical protein SEA_JAEK_7 [Arthrobacter phage Jaek]QJD51739.1 hypothetical protein SEA_BOERSMA_7 [Arthrobacter phage Boersma]QOR56066.1 hypothetical protein SEA_THUNDERCLAP_7 [Arthrobacter phage Thunderclap]
MNKRDRGDLGLLLMGVMLGAVFGGWFWAWVWGIYG